VKAPISLTAEELLAVLGKARERRLRDWVMLLFLYWHGFRVSEIAGSSTRQLGLFFTIEKAEQRCNEAAGAAAIEEVRRRVKGKMRTCYLVTSDRLIAKPGLTFNAIEGSQITVQRLKRSEQTTQLLQEHEHPLLNEKLAWEEWLAERPRFGKKGGAKMQQKDVLMQNGPDARVFEISRSQLFRIYRRCATEAGLVRRKRHQHCLRHTIGTDLVDAGVPLPDVQAHLGHRSLASTGVYTLPKEDAVSGAVGKAIRGKHEFRRAQQGILFT
jgi:site-specific recombinase XerD